MSELKSASRECKPMPPDRSRELSFISSLCRIFHLVQQTTKIACYRLCIQKQYRLGLWSRAHTPLLVAVGPTEGGSPLGVDRLKQGGMQQLSYTSSLIYLIISVWNLNDRPFGTTCLQTCMVSLAYLPLDVSISSHWLELILTSVSLHTFGAL